MTGAEHYREAEKLLGEATENQFHNGSGDPVTPELLAAAQVHATLAHAAATALAIPDGLPSGDWDDWRFVASSGHAGRIPGSEREVTP